MPRRIESEVVVAARGRQRLYFRDHRRGAGSLIALLVLVLYALAIIALRAIGRARDRFGKAVIGGILVWIVGQAFVNIAVVIGILPQCPGVPLPLISAGGTALIACLVMGVVISIARDGDSYQEERASASGARR